MHDSGRTQNWQFQFVAEYGPDTARAQELCAAIPLRVERENLPVGSLGGPDTDPVLITGPYLRIFYGVPSDPVEGTVTGKIRIVRKGSGFSRDWRDTDEGSATLVADLDLSAELGSLDRDVYLEDREIVDQSLGAVAVTWYYTAFYEVLIDAELMWTFSPVYTHARNWPNSNLVDASGAGVSLIGTHMYANLPRKVRTVDREEGELTLYRLFQLFGRALDSLRDHAYQTLQTANNIDTCDAAVIPYLDYLLGWPTNFELSEDRRRAETRNAANLWKLKGTKDALELALQTITRWDVEVFEGWKWILHSPSHDAYDPLSPPLDWEESTDGVWEDLVDALPLQVTPSADLAQYNAFAGTRDDVLCRTPSTEELNNTGVGWSWQNLNGLLITLAEIEGVSGPISETLARKIVRMAPLFAPFYAAFAFASEILTTEEAYAPFTDEWTTAVIGFLTGETYAPLTGEAFLEAESPELYTLTSVPHPLHPLDSTTDSELYLTPHTSIAYGGT